MIDKQEAGGWDFGRSCRLASRPKTIIQMKRKEKRAIRWRAVRAPTGGGGGGDLPVPSCVWYSYRHDKGRKNINSRFVSSRMGDFDGVCGMAWRLGLCCSGEPASGIGRNPVSCFTEWGCGVGGDACGGSGIAAALCGCHVGARIGVGGCADSAGEFGVVRRRDGGAWRRHRRILRRIVASVCRLRVAVADLFPVGRSGGVGAWEASQCAGECGWATAFAGSFGG